MNLSVALLSLAAALAMLWGCSFSSDGSVSPAQPKAIQGKSTVQGAPITVPGAGMGVGAGNPDAATGGPAR